MSLLILAGHPPRAGWACRARIFASETTLEVRP